jgi:hypothetical protein
VHKRIISPVKGVEFLTDRKSCRWCHIIVLNVHDTTEDKTDDVKDSFYEELERVFDKFPKYHTKIMLGDFNAKVDREEIFKLTIGNESLHKIRNDNGVDFATSKTLTVNIIDYYYYYSNARVWLKPVAKVEEGPCRWVT